MHNSRGRCHINVKIFFLQLKIPFLSKKWVVALRFSILIDRLTLLIIQSADFHYHNQIFHVSEIIVQILFNRVLPTELQNSILQSVGQCNNFYLIPFHLFRKYSRHFSGMNIPSLSSGCPRRAFPPNNVLKEVSQAFNLI